MQNCPRRNQRKPKEADMTIIDTTSGIQDIFIDGHFDLSKWEEYIEKFVPGAKDICLNDMMDCRNAGYTWEKDYLPILDSVYSDINRRDKAIESFAQVTSNLDDRIYEVFHRTVDVDVYLYLGLCNGAGWVTSVLGKTTILLGIEKIIELDWCDVDSMNGLIIHELGHAYQNQYGILKIATESLSDSFLWQLFTEGVAMTFEQEIIGSSDYFHQDRNGWKAWCETHLELITKSFCDDMKTMTRENQRYFGDWVDFYGHIDVGYYLGTRFVRFMMETDSFDNIINYRLNKVKEEFKRFGAKGEKNVFSERGVTKKIHKCL
jgi:hypothetical protein